MADGMEEDDPFAFIERSCHIPVSQSASLRNCPLDRQHEVFEDPDLFPLASESAPSQPAGILMDNVPESQDTAEQESEDHAVFHTPPEHHINSSYSSSGDRNPDELSAQGARTVELGNGKDASEKCRCFEGGLGDEPELNKIRVPVKELSGETVPLGRTEEVLVDTTGTDADGATEVMCLDSDVTKDSHDILKGARAEVCAPVSRQKTTRLTEQCAPFVGALDDNHELGRKSGEPMGNVRIHGSSDITWSLDSRETRDEIVRLKSLVGNRSGKVAKISENEKMTGDGNASGGLRNGGKRSDDIDQFMFAGWNDVSRRWRDRKASASGPSDRRRQLPASVKGTDEKQGGSIEVREKNDGGSSVAGTVETTCGRLIKGKDKIEGSKAARNMGTKSGGLNNTNVEKDGGNNVEGKVETESGLMSMLDVIKTILRNLDDDESDDNKDILEIAKKKGIEIPRPGWWPPDGGSSVAGTVETMGGRLIKGKDKIEGSKEARNMGTKNGEQNNTNVEKDGGSNVEGKVETESGLMSMLDVIKTILGNLDDDDEDFLEIAKKKGIEIPRPRWWPPEWSD